MLPLILTALLMGCPSGSSPVAPVVQLDCPDKAELKWGPTLQGDQHWCQRGLSMEGPFLRIHPEGAQAITGSYLANQPNGEWIWKSASGQIITKGTYRNGKMAGRWTWWHENGELKQTGEFADGRQSGSWPAWHDNGQKAEEGLYINGSKDGVWRYWSREGEEIRAEYWRQGIQLE